MQDIAVFLRFLQLYTHNAHHLIDGTGFFADHEFLGDLYEAFEKDYDDVAERMVGMDMNPDLTMIQRLAAGLLEHHAISNKAEDVFRVVLKLEETLCDLLQKEVQGKSEGTRQMLGDIANNSEKRQYKIKQRLK